MNDFWNEILAFAETTTAQVGGQLLEDFGQVQAAEKEDGSLITRSDRWADETIRNAIADRFPHHGILSEESNHVLPDNDWCWVIDPLDGTTNFARCLPIWAISIALLYRGTPAFGYVCLPPLGQSFHGFWYGNSGLTGPTGAFLNHRPLKTSADSPSGNQFFSLCTRSIGVLQSGSFPCKIRMLGVASYNLLTVAAGLTLGALEATPKVWDFSAVWVILQAAGGVWISLDSPSPFPLKVGEDYGRRSYPTLVANRPESLPIFEPAVQRWHQSASPHAAGGAVKADGSRVG